MDPIGPTALADLMLASAVQGRADLVALRRDGDRCLVTLCAKEQVLDTMVVPTEVGLAAAVRLALAAGLNPVTEAGDDGRRVGWVFLDIDGNVGQVGVSVVDGRAGPEVEIRPLGPSIESPRTGSLKRCVRCGAFQPPQRSECDQDGGTLVGVVDSAAPGGTIGAYCVSSLLGKGSMGAVFAAEHALIGRKVAIKVLHRPLATNLPLARRFLREARVASRLRHPNIVEVTDFGLVHDGRPFVVMERLTGQTLDTVLVEGRPLTLLAAVCIAREIARALEAAHGAGVLHNDLKPANVMILQGSSLEAPRLKLLDFGAASVASDADDDGLDIGTPLYMSPERANSQPPDARDDLYSLGVLLYEMLTGKVPYSGRTVSSVRNAQLNDPLPEPVNPYGALPRPLYRAVTTALAKDPEARYQSVGDLILDLDLAAEALGPEAKGRRTL